MRMSVWGGTNFVTEVTLDVTAISPGVGRMICLECGGHPEAYAARFGNLRNALAPNGCVDCKNRGWVYVNA